MAHNTTPEYDAHELEVARERWSGFTQLVKYSSVAVAMVLILMLIFVY